MSNDEKKLAIGLPGEWILQKTLGPVLSEIGDDIKKMYAKGRDNIVAKAYSKIENPNDGKSANLRIAYESLASGSFANDEICAEYFGGILASSRTADGKSDDTIELLSTIKTLSSKQLHLHYAFYNSLNKLLVSKSEYVNVGLSTEIKPKKVWFSTMDLLSIGIKVDTDFNILYRQNLLEEYKTDSHSIGQGKVVPYSYATPTTYGVLLYSVAHNKLERWKLFSKELFPDFDGVKLPKYFGFSLDDLLKSAGITSPNPVQE